MVAGKVIRSFGAALLISGVGAAAQAQDLEYTSTTQFSVSPALGPMGGMMGGGRSMSSHVYVKGTRLRFDIGTQSSSIIDAARRQITMLDHARRMARTMTLTQTNDPRVDSLANASNAVLSVQRTSEVRRINGVAARRTNIIVRVPARNPRAANANDVIVTHELWTTDANAIGGSYQRVSQFADQLGAGASMMFGMMAQNARVGAAMHKASKAATQVRGMPVRTVVAYGNIPSGRKFLMGMAMDTMMAVTTNVTGIRTARLAPSLFEVPRGYTLVTGTGERE